MTRLDGLLPIASIAVLLDGECTKDQLFAHLDKEELFKGCHAIIVALRDENERVMNERNEYAKKVINIPEPIIPNSHVFVNAVNAMKNAQSLLEDQIYELNKFVPLNHD